MRLQAGLQSAEIYLLSVEFLAGRVVLVNLENVKGRGMITRLIDMRGIYP